MTAQRGSGPAADATSAAQRATVRRVGSEPGRQPVAGSPWLPRSYLERPALWAMLDAGTELGVTMLVAPAGAGKTLGVAGWLQQRAAEPTHWVDAPTLNAPSLERLLEEAGSREGPPALVVVEDAHALPATAVRALDARLGLTPDRLRVVLLTRWDLPLRRLVPQLLGHLTVIRGDALRLTDAETDALVRVHVPDATPELVSAIQARAQGWCAAVVLASRASAASPSSADAVRRFRTPGPGVADLVAGEVFAGMRPEEQHLLLCCASEQVLTGALANRLTGDPGAGDALAALEQTGLLVNRVAGGRDEETDADPADVRFTIHPLLREVARRRLVARGADARRARASVLREARLDLAQGDIGVGFVRLMALGEHDRAVQVVADHGLWMAFQGDGAGLDALVRTAGAAVEERPDVWPTIAWTAWARGVPERAEHWARRVAAAGSATEPIQAAGVALRRTRYAEEQPGAALAEGLACLDGVRTGHGRDPWLAALLLEIGVAENWLGLLADAEGHLGEAVVIGRGTGLDGLVAEAFSHLALTQFMLGRDTACLDLTDRVLAADARDRVPADALARAETARELVELGALPFADVVAAPAGVNVVPDDPTARFWRRVADAGRALQAGSLAAAERALDLRGPGTRLPAHLLGVLLVERAAVAVAAGDRQSLRTVAAELQRVDATGELAWVQGALADLEGDLRSASVHYDHAGRLAAARHDVRLGSVALVCSAQVQASLGDQPGAVRRLGEALALTQPDRFAWAFLGWSTHGTRVGALMDLLEPGAETTWTEEVRRACAERPSIVARFRSLVATERELETVTAPVAAPALSPREHEVLIELARGSTYADIAGNLFVSENTVKTHISSLYSKLSAGRRSEALAVARTLHLI